MTTEPNDNKTPATKRILITCTMCMDTNECPECDPDAPDDNCTMCSGSGECPECGIDGTDQEET